MRQHPTILAIIALFLLMLLAAPRTLAQATDEAEPPDGPLTEPIKAPEPPIVAPTGPPPTKPTKALPEADGTMLADPAAAAAPPAPAQNDTPGSELFVAAANALRRAQSIRYHAKAYATGAMFEPHTAKIQADVRMLRWASAGSQTNGWLIRSTGSGKPKSTSEEMNFDVAWTGSNIEFVSHTDRKVIEKRQPRDAKNPAFQIATSSRNDELFAARPFSKELAVSAEYEVGSRQTVEGVECDVVTVNFGEKKSKVRYAFATTDHLPRKIERIIEGTMASGSMVLEISNVEVEDASPPRLGPEALKVEVPEGYTEERLPKPAAAPVLPKMPPSGEGVKAVPETTITDKVPPDPAAGIDTPPADAPKVDPTTPVSVEPTPPPPAPAAAVIATPFELRASTGDRISLESLKGNYVVLEFGGSWCLPCRESHNELDALLQRFSGKPVKVLALSCRDKSPDAAIERFKQRAHAFPLLVEADAVAKSWGVRTYPSYFVVGLDGQFVKTDFAYVKGITVPGLGDAIDAVLNPPGPGVTPAAGETPAESGSMLTPLPEK